MYKKILHHNNPGGYREKYLRKGHSIHDNIGFFTIDKIYALEMERIEHDIIKSFNLSFQILNKCRKSKGVVILYKCDTLKEWFEFYKEQSEIQAIKNMLPLDKGIISYSVSTLNGPLSNFEFEESCRSDIEKTYKDYLPNIKDIICSVKLFNRSYYYIENGKNNLIRLNYHNTNKCELCNERLEEIMAG